MSAAASTPQQAPASPTAATPTAATRLPPAPSPTAKAHTEKVGGVRVTRWKEEPSTLLENAASASLHERHRTTAHAWTAASRLSLFQMRAFRGLHIGVSPADEMLFIRDVDAGGDGALTNPLRGRTRASREEIALSSLD